MCYLRPKLTLAASAFEAGVGDIVYLEGKYIAPFHL